MIQALRHYLLALQFFTRIPVTGRLAAWVGYTPEMLRASTAHFPGVGWLVGGLSAALLAALLHLLPPVPASAWAAAVGCTVFSVLLTGAFHEDGLADLADGLGGSLDREHALDIMKDSRIGSFGAMALALGLLSKLALLALLAQVDPLLAVTGTQGKTTTTRLAESGLAAITVPLLAPVIFFNLVLQMIEAFKSFTGAFVISGGRGAPLDSLLFFTVYLYNEAFSFFRMGYASALAWVLLLIIALFTAVAFWSSRYFIIGVSPVFWQVALAANISLKRTNQSLRD